MPDLLVSLIHLKPLEPMLAPLRARGVTLRRPNAWEQQVLRTFILNHFQPGWADEVSVAFSHQPVTAFVALHEGRITGFAGYECSRRNFFGPTGVAPQWRGSGVGRALFHASLHGLRQLGYVYAVVGGAGPVGFYEREAGAIVIPFDERRGIYGLMEEPDFSDLTSGPAE